MTSSSAFPYKIKVEMDNLLSFLLELGFVNDQNFPFLRPLSKEELEVSFKGAEWVSIAMDNIDYADIHEELSEKRAYNIKMLDGGILQMMYRFIGDHLIQHRLAYFPSPNLRSFSDAPEAYMEDDLYVDIMSRRVVPFPLRFDFDEINSRDVAHPKCHLTLGDVKNCRIPVSTPLTPSRFIGFILRNFYETDKHKIPGKLPNLKINFPQCISTEEYKIIHIVVPKEI